MSLSADYGLLVLVKPGRCVQCDAVLRKLKQADVPHCQYTLFDESGNVLKEFQEIYETAKARGASSAPLVVLSRDGEVWDLFGGYNPIKLKEFISCVTTAP